MKQLYFIRHGQSVLNAQKILAGHTDTPLTEKGRAQAVAAGKAAKDLAIDCIVSSPLSRAHETARIVADHISYPHEHIVLQPLVIERSYGPLEGSPWDTEVHIDDEPGTETLESVLARAHQTLEYIQSLPYETILIASHGTFGLALRAAISEQPAFKDVDDLPNATIVRFV